MLFLLKTPSEAVLVVLRCAQDAAPEPLRYWTLTDGDWAPVLGDEANGLLVRRDLFELFHRFDASVTARPAVIEAASPRRILTDEYVAVESSSGPYPKFINVSEDVRRALELAGFTGIFALPLFAA